VSKKLTHDFTINNSRDQFLKAQTENDEVTILTHQSSAMLNTFSVANALLFAPNGNYTLEKNSKVDIYQIL